MAELLRRGHQVTVLTGIPNYPAGAVFPDYRADPARFARYEGAEVIRAPMLVRGQGRLSLMLNFFTFALGASLWGGWKLRRRAFDAIFTFEVSPITVGIPSAWLRFLSGAPQVFWVLDLWPETLKAVGVLKADWMLRLVAPLVRFVYRHCDLLLAQSRSFVADVARHAPPGRRIEYFPAWADAVFEAGAVTPAPEVPAAPGVFTVVFAGNIGEAQDFPAILDAAERLRARRDIRWVIVGDGRMSEWVRGEIARRGLADSMLMVGRHPLERMPDFFAHAQALLVSLKRDPVFAMTIPGKMQSYFATGLPVLAMLDGEGARIVGEAQAGLVCAAGDGAGLAGIVERMAALDAESRRRMGENGRELCAREFDRDRLIDRLEGWLAELAAQRSVAGAGRA